MRNRALQTIEEMMATDPLVFFIGSDLGAGTLETAKDKFPDRVLMEGIAEQHLVGFAAGLAHEGFFPIVHTISTFLTRRSYEQIAVDVALDLLPVLFLGSGGGMVYAPLGPTHQAIEDFALMSSIPGMAVVAPADPEEMSITLKLLRAEAGPAYVRVGKGGEPIVTSTAPPLKLGQMRLLIAGERIALVTTGALLHECLGAAQLLEAEGIFPTVSHFPFVSPFDEDGLESLASNHDYLLVVEEHIPRGGLSSRVAETVAERRLDVLTHKLTLGNSFAHAYGSQQEHWGHQHLDASGIQGRVKNILSQNQK